MVEVLWAGIEKMEWDQQAANRISNLAFRCCTGQRLTDINTCHKAFKKEVLEGMRILSRDFHLRD